MTRFLATSTDGLRVDGYPLSGPITSHFGDTDITEHAQGHTGIDIAAAEGTPIRAPVGSVVLDAFCDGAELEPWRVAWCRVFGNAVILDHGDLVTLYAHMRDHPSVRAGDAVSAGDVLGLVGSTGTSSGPHLHWGCAPASNPYLRRDGLGGLLDPLWYAGPEQPQQPQQPPADHDPVPEAPTPAYLARSALLAAQVLDRLVAGGAPLAAVADYARRVKEAAIALGG